MTPTKFYDPSRRYEARMENTTPLVWDTLEDRIDSFPATMQEAVATADRRNSAHNAQRAKRRLFAVRETGRYVSESEVQQLIRRRRDLLAKMRAATTASVRTRFKNRAAELYGRLLVLLPGTVAERDEEIRRMTYEPARVVREADRFYVRTREQGSAFPGASYVVDRKDGRVVRRFASLSDDMPERIEKAQAYAASRNRLVVREYVASTDRPDAARWRERRRVGWRRTQSAKAREKRVVRREQEARRDVRRERRS